MPFNFPKDYLHLARTEAGLGTAAANRSAISRAYYAAYHAAVRLLPQRAKTLKSQGQTHKFLWDMLGASSDRLHQNFARVGQGLLRERNRADYDSVWDRNRKVDNPSDKDVEGAIMRAERLITNVATADDL